MKRAIPCVLAAATLFGAAQAGDEPIAAKDPIVPDEAPALSPPKRVNWWSLPRPARVAVQNLAASRDASVTRCLAVDRGDTISYEFHASRRTGLFKRTDFVLTRESEPKARVEERQAENTLKRRVERLRASLSLRPKGDNIVGRTGFLDPNAK